MFVVMVMLLLLTNVNLFVPKIVYMEPVWNQINASVNLVMVGQGVLSHVQKEDGEEIANTIVNAKIILHVTLSQEIVNVSEAG